MEPEIEEQPTRVGIGLIGRGGSYLIRQRPPGSAMAGYWEFPGGKCEPGESPEAATARECLEEVGVEVSLGEQIHRVIQRYPHGLIDLLYYRCSTDGEPRSDSGFVWIPAEALLSYRFPEANDAVIAILTRDRVLSTGSPRDES